MLMKIIAPLNFLLLTPLVLARFSTLELDVFYLIASTTILFSLFQNRFSNVFERMLSFAFGGASDLGKWTGDKAPSTGEPNWEMFKEAYMALGALLFISCLPSLIMSVGLMWLSVGFLVDFSYQDRSLWIGAILGAVSPSVSFLMLRPNLALRATGKIALQNRINTITGVASIVVSAIVVLAGGRLIGIICVRLFFTTLARWVMIQFLSVEVKPYASKFKWSSKIFAWAREPIWKGLVSVLAGMGVHRGVGVFLAFTGSVGFAAPFLFIQSLLTTCQGIACAPLYSQIPRYSKMLEEGKRAEIGADSFLRIVFTTLLMAAAVLGVSFVIPAMLPLVGANMTPLSATDSLLLGGLRCVYWPLICFNTVQGVSNDVKVVWRFVFAMPFAILLFYIGSQTQQYYWFSLGMYLPYIVALNWFTWGNYLEFIGKDWLGIAKGAQAIARKRIPNFFS